VAHEIYYVDDVRRWFCPHCRRVLCETEYVRSGGYWVRRGKRVKNAESIYKRAIEKFGVGAQIGMVFEEMSELQKELCKYMRGKKNIQEIAEEMADVEIMLGQMKELFDINQLVEEEKERKLERLEKLLA
jgi:hypothetical protein